MSKQIYNLKIDEELRDLLPPLAEDEYKQLEDNLIKDGCQSPLFIWKGFIADGHNRYGICQKNQIPFEIVNLGYEDKADVMRWMIDTQIGRRNLEPIQRVQIAEKYRPVYEDKAKKNMALGGGDQKTGKPKSANPIKPINTRDELAKIAGVGHDTYNKGRSILNSDNEEVKKNVLSGKISINEGYNKIKPKETKVEKPIIKPEAKQEPIQKPTIKICKKCNKEKPNIDFYDGDDICKECKRSEQQDFEVTNKSQGGSAFKDSATGEEIKYDKESVNSESMAESLKEIKTEKRAEDCVDPDGVVSWTEEVSDDFVEQLINQYFVIQKAINKLDDNHIENVTNILESVVSKIKGIEIKLNNKKENN